MTLTYSSFTPDSLASVTCCLLLKSVGCVDEVAFTTFDLGRLLRVLDHRTALHAVASRYSIWWNLVDRLTFSALDLRRALNKLKDLLAFVTLSTTLWQTWHSFSDYDLSEW